VTILKWKIEKPHSILYMFSPPTFFQVYFYFHPWSSNPNIMLLINKKLKKKIQSEWIRIILFKRM